MGLSCLGESVLSENVTPLLDHGAGTPLPYTELDVDSRIISRFNLDMDAVVDLELADTRNRTYRGSYKSGHLI